jgi:ABC-type sulfate transport system permease component
MSSAYMILMRIGLYILVAGIVYGITSHEAVGGTMLVVAALTFGYLAFVIRTAVRGVERVAPGDRGDAEEAAIEMAHVGPTIWPFVFSIAAIILGFGIALSRWLLPVGAVLFVAAATGWFLDIRGQNRHEH